MAIKLLTMVSAGALLLAACATETPPPVAEPEPAAPATDAAALPVQDYPFPDVGLSPDVPAAAVEACEAELASQTEGDVAVRGTEFSQANNAVYMTVGPQQAPWRCLVSSDGQIAELSFFGDEGGL